MQLYITLLLLFFVGFIGIYFLNRKEPEEVKRKMNWIKYSSYFILVFVQQFFIANKCYVYFVIIISLFGFCELVCIQRLKNKNFVRLISFGVWIVFYIFFFKEIEFKLQQFVFIIVITFDGYSQIFGQLFGEIRLFPKTNSNKTLEGLFWGTFLAIVTAFLLSYILNINQMQAICFVLFVSVFSVVADFLTSYYKRKNEVKDYVDLIPVHCGILDRFDSIIVASFGCYFLFKLDFLNSNFFILQCVNFLF